MESKILLSVEYLCLCNAAGGIFIDIVAALTWDCGLGFVSEYMIHIQ